MSGNLLVNLLMLVCLPIASAAVTERLIRNWQWPFQFRLRTIFWSVSGVAAVLAAIRTEQILYAGRGGGPIDALHPWIKVPVLIGCLCTFYLVTVLAWRTLAGMKAVTLASCRQMR